MGQVLHGSATTKSLRQLARRYGINQKTVAKWKNRTSVADLPTSPKEPKSSVLSVEEEAIIVAFRKHTLLPLDDCLYALQPTIPYHPSHADRESCFALRGKSRKQIVRFRCPKHQNLAISKQPATRIATLTQLLNHSSRTTR
jgi:hypothetical protein